MNLLKVYREWRDGNEERDEFNKAWNQLYIIGSKVLTESNSCNSYHRDVAFDLFQMQKRIEALETQNEYLLDHIAVLNERINKIVGNQ